ncbi:MAG: M43 family zinc metalloprotease [Bacteroidia bacterium]|nr:M43 family zinc metalloprotease [Bacteroidia bacterium]
MSVILTIFAKVRMRSPLILLFLMFFSMHAQFQCGLGYAMQTLISQHPQHVRHIDFSGLPPLTTAQTCYTIPVVFHILHLNGPENISDMQILDALNILNEDFRKQNSDTSNIVPAFKNLAADACLQFTLASKDPQGKCTKGILRHFDSLTYWTTVDISNYKYAWPSDKYLNIYVVKQLPPGAGGYAFLPGTVSSALDGIVILHNMVGSIGTSNPWSSRSLTHEMGHMLGLPHVWGLNNNPGVTCGDDGINDTPVTKGWTICNPTQAFVCNPAILENVQNYMEYSFCSCMFTHGQKNRMHQIIQNNIASRGDLVSSQNLINTGVVNPNYNCPPRPLFSVLPKETYLGGYSILKDMSDYSVPSTWLWKSNKSPFTYSQPTVNMLFNRSGFADVFLKCGNAYGYDSIMKINEVAVQSTIGGIVNVDQGFENINFPDSVWFTGIPTMGSPFKQNNIASHTGQKSLMIDVYNDLPNSNVNLYFPMFDIQGLNQPVLEFYYASAQMQTGSQASLRVWVKNMGSPTWTLLSTISGSSLNTGGSTFQNYVPSPSEWKKFTHSLGSYTTTPQLFFKIEYVRDPNGLGNNVYLDDIKIGEPLGLKDISSVNSNCKVYNIMEKNSFKIHCPEISNLISWSVSDMSGRILLKSDNAENFLNGPISLPCGIYLLTLNTKSNSYHHKIVLH